METKPLEATLGYGTPDVPGFSFTATETAQGLGLGHCWAGQGPGWPLKPRRSADNRALTAIKKGLFVPLKM